MVRYAFLAVFLLVVGCSEQKKSEPLDDVRDKLIFDLFDGVENGEHQDTFKTLARLKTVISHDQFLEQLYVKTNNNVSLIKADQALKAGDLDSASFHASAVEDQTLHGDIQALRVVKNYLDQKPFSTSEEAYKALKNLESTNDRFAKMKSYIKWLAAEKKFADDLYEKEYKALLALAVKTYSKKLIASSGFTNYCLAHIDMEEISGKELGKVLSSLCDFNPDMKLIKSDDFESEVGKINNSSIKKLREISKLFETNEDRKALSQLLKFVEDSGKVSWNLQKRLLQRSDKIKRIIAGDDFLLLEDVVSAFEEAEEIERRLREKAEEERLRKEKELQKRLEEIRKKAESMTTD